MAVTKDHFFHYCICACVC